MLLILRKSSRVVLVCVLTKDKRQKCDVRRKNFCEKQKKRILEKKSLARNTRQIIIIYSYTTRHKNKPGSVPPSVFVCLSSASLVCVFYFSAMKKATTTTTNEKSENERSGHGDVVRELNLFVGKREGETRKEEEPLLLEEHHGGHLQNARLPPRLPTSDREVKERLRSVNEPICLFGEGKAERRERLKRILLSTKTTGEQEEGVTTTTTTGREEDEEYEDDRSNGETDANSRRRKKRKETFYTEGSALLTRARMRAAKFSLQRARERVLADSKNDKSNNNREKEEKETRATFFNRRRKECANLKRSRFAPVSSVIGDSRPLSAVASLLFEPDEGSVNGLMLASSIKNENDAVEEDFHTESLGVVLSGSWTGAVKVWNVRNSVNKENEDKEEQKEETMKSSDVNISCSSAYTIRASEERITGLAFSPLIGATIDNEDLPAFASASMDGTCALFNFSGKKLASLVGHVGRLAKVKYHPSGTSIATAGYDKTIRLWDANTSQEIFCQEAHSRPSYDCAFNGDGSLLFSTGLDSYARMWDLRSGRCLWTMKGHSKGVTSVSVDVTNSLCVTGGEDNLVKVWDLRKQENAYTIPAHSRLVSSVSFEPKRGCWFSSSSFDGTIKLWSAIDFSLLACLEGHEGKVMDCSLGRAGERRDFPGLIASAGYDRTLKIWK